MVHPRVTRLPESYGECRGRAIVHDAGSIANSFAPVGVTRAAWAMSLNSLERIRRLISWARARCRATRGPSVGETICCDVRGRPEPPESTVNVTVALSILARRRPVPSAREMIVWSRTLPTVARRISRCSSVVNVVGLRLAIADRRVEVGEEVKGSRRHARAIALSNRLAGNGTLEGARW